jgi:hypothetical protein
MTFTVAVALSARGFHLGNPFTESVGLLTAEWLTQHNKPATLRGDAARPSGPPFLPGKRNGEVLARLCISKWFIKVSGTGTERSSLSFGRKPSSGFDRTLTTFPLKSTFRQVQYCTS